VIRDVNQTRRHDLPDMARAAVEADPAHRPRRLGFQFTAAPEGHGRAADGRRPHGPGNIRRLAAPSPARASAATQTPSSATEAVGARDDQPGHKVLHRALGTYRPVPREGTGSWSFPAGHLASAGGRGQARCSLGSQVSGSDDDEQAGAG